MRLVLLNGLTIQARTFCLKIVELSHLRAIQLPHMALVLWSSYSLSWVILRVNLCISWLVLYSKECGRMQGCRSVSWKAYLIYFTILSSLSPVSKWPLISAFKMSNISYQIWLRKCSWVLAPHTCLISSFLSSLSSTPLAIRTCLMRDKAILNLFPSPSHILRKVSTDCSRPWHFMIYYSSLQWVTECISGWRISSLNGSSDMQKNRCSLL